MKKANEILEELRSMDSILADLPRTMPYSVPVGYFTEFAGAVHNVITYASGIEQAPAWGKAMPFTIPDNYFNELQDEVTTKGIASSLPKTTPFAVPSGYFNTLPSQMLRAVKAADAVTGKPNVIPLKRTNLFRSLRWAAAAVLLLGVGFGAYEKFFNTQQSDPENMLSSVPGNEIQDYVQRIYRMDADRIVSNDDISDMQLDNKDIIAYLDKTGWE